MSGVDFRERVYTLDGSPVDVEEFFRDNEHLGDEDRREVERLEVGDEVVYGGGAAPEFVLRREE